MEHWQKLVIDPGHFTVLKSLEEEKTKEEVSKEVGMKKIRSSKLLSNLMEEKLVQAEVTEGKRKFCSESLEEEKESLKIDLASSTIGGVRKAIEQENFGKARKHLTSNLPVEGELREKVAKLEAAEKLSEIC